MNGVFRSTVLAKLLYCSPTWSGFCSAADRARLDAFLRRCQRLGYCSRETPAITELLDEADETLFGSILANSNHVLHFFAKTVPIELVIVGKSVNAHIPV